MGQGWVRFPAVRGDRVVFVADDDLFEVPLAGGLARRITSEASAPLRPRWSPDGASLTWDSTAEGARDVWTCPAEGGRAARLTWGGATNLGHDPRGRTLVSSSRGQPFPRDTVALALGDAEPTPLPFGPLAGLAAGPGGRVLLVRHATELTSWRGYRGGRAGVAWLGIPRRGDGTDWVSDTFAWEKVRLPHAVASPAAFTGRFFLVGDPGPSPELVSVDADGRDPQIHTALGGFGVRHLHSDGGALVFTHEGRLMRWTGAEVVEIPVVLAAQRVDRQRRPFVARVADDVDIHPDGHSLAVVSRGRAASFAFWEGPVRRWGSKGSVRNLFARWVDAERLLVVCDAGGEYHFELHGAQTRVFPADHGRVVNLEVDPTGRRVAFSDHEHHLHVLDLVSGERVSIEHCPPGHFDLDWSADGRWLAWTRFERTHRGRLRLWRADDGQTFDVTDGSYDERSPSFDPDGNYLYFLSLRDFDPVRDTVSFGYAFPRGFVPLAVALRRDVAHPFRPAPRPLKAPPSSRTPPERPPVQIDIEGLQTRIAPFPVPDGRWGRIVGLPGGSALLQRDPVRGTLDRHWSDDRPPVSESSLHLWDGERQELHDVTTRVGSFRVDRRREHVVIQTGWRLRVAVAKADKGAREELKKTDGRAERKTGFVDLGRFRDEIDPVVEWRQMLDDAFRLMRDHYWRAPDPDLYARATDARDRAMAALPAISTRSEWSDVLISMLGAWGTSHAYEMGGDVPPVTHRRNLGHLGADVQWSSSPPGYRLTRIFAGDPGTERTSPLLAPGVCLREGDVITAIDGAQASRDLPIDALLVDRARAAVSLDVSSPEDGLPRTVVAIPLGSDRDLRYREWVQSRRERVRDRSQGRIGYLHVPNMGPAGFAEFHRDLATALDADALLVDVRYNGGGHVSQLLLRLLGARRLGRSEPRHGGGRPWPRDAPPEPKALLTNEAAGSDGDIFTHAWKAMALGPVFGTRTWGGVVGISPTLRLVDRTLTTQPEYAAWFEGVGYGIENRGVDPDVEIELAPDVAASGDDPMLDAAVEHLTSALGASRPAGDPG